MRWVQGLSTALHSEATGSFPGMYYIWSPEYCQVGHPPPSKNNNAIQKNNCFPQRIWDVRSHLLSFKMPNNPLMWGTPSEKPHNSLLSPMAKKLLPGCPTVMATAKINSGIRGQGSPLLNIVPVSFRDKSAPLRPLSLVFQIGSYNAGDA